MKEKSKIRSAPAASLSSKAPTLAAKSGLQRSQGQQELDEEINFLAPPQNADEIGRLGPYRILKILGRGGMGIVFKAEDDRLHRLVALKVMLPSVALKKTSRTRFKREAEVTAKIEHDHIVTIYEVGQDQDLPYLAMQFLKGMTLDDWLKTGKPLKMSQIMRIGKEIAKGLAAAHARHLIHRDIKPSNIWLDATNKGRVKILDFGLARPTQGEDTELTHQGAIIGTPAFMSPEQARGEVVDERSDLFSLGGVLYRLCTGRFAFNGHDPLSVLYAILNKEPPSIERANAEVPPGLAQLIHQLLEKDPSKRPASANDVVKSLEELERAWLSRAKTQTSGTVTSIKAAKSPHRDDTAVALDESAISQDDLTVPDIEEPSSKSWLIWGGALLGLGLCAFIAFAVLLSGVVVWFKTNNGEVRIAIVDEAARDVLNEHGVAFVDQHKNKHVFKDEAHTLPLGTYVLDPASVPASLLVEPKSFSLQRGDLLEVKVQLVLLARLEHLSMQTVTSDNIKKLQEDWGKALQRNLVEQNSLGMKLVLIPAGVFTMGSTPEAAKKFADEAKDLPPEMKELYLKQIRTEVPLHKVHLTRPFALGMYEVTVDEFQKFVDATNYRPEMERANKPGAGLENGTIIRKPDFTWQRTGFNQSKQHPVANITWGDAEAFCRWLGKKEKKFYRLPTEAEWEHACRAGTSTAWSFGDTTAEGKYMQSLNVGKPLNALAGSLAVGSKLPNVLGLHDMHGNVDEMCGDTWSADYYAKSPLEDPTGPHGDFAKGKQPLPNFLRYFGGDKGKHGFEKGRPPFGKGFGDKGKPPQPPNQPEPTREKVARGGSFLEAPQLGRSAYRHAFDLAQGQVQLGFRVVCEITLPN